MRMTKTKIIIIIIIMICSGLILKMLKNDKNDTMDKNEYFCVARKVLDANQNVVELDIKCDQYHNRNFSPGQSPGSYHAKWHKDVNACQLNMEQMKFMADIAAAANTGIPAPSANKDKCESLNNPNYGLEYEWTTKNSLESSK